MTLEANVSKATARKVDPAKALVRKMGDHTLNAGPDIGRFFREKKTTASDRNVALEKSVWAATTRSLAMSTSAIHHSKQTAAILRAI